METPETQNVPNPPSSTPPPAAPPGAPPGQPPLPGVPGAPPPVAASPPPVKGKKKFIRIPQKEFRKRIENLKDVSIRNDYGLSPEELKRAADAYKAGGGAPAPGTPPAPSTPPSPPAPAAEPQRKDSRVKQLERENQILQEKLEKSRTRARNRQMETEIQADAKISGVLSEHMDFALDLYRRAVKNAAEAKKEAVLPAAFFSELRKTKSYLFNGEPPAPPEVRPSNAPPESPNPGENRPAPPAPGAPPKVEVNVDEMDGPQFAAYRKSKYGT